MALARHWPRVRIVSDGLNKLQVFDSEGNEILLGCIHSVTWKFYHDKPARFFIELLPAGLEAEGDLTALAGSLDTTAEKEERPATARYDDWHDVP